jgi:hypothetical protein
MYDHGRGREIALKKSIAREVATKPVPHTLTVGEPRLFPPRGSNSSLRMIWPRPAFSSANDTRRIASQYWYGEDITIADLARLIAQVTGYRGELVFDPSRPDGTPQKLLDISKLRALGWKARTPLALGLARSYGDFLAQGGGHSVGKIGM